MRLLCIALVGLVLLAETARADSLDLQSWLDRPGVRAVAVEFFAPWCKPCMEAMPRWKALKERYGKDGLRVIFINADAEGDCPSLPFKPDDLVCDLDGAKKQLFGVNNLPSAFLWSWDRRLLVRGGHIDAVESAVESLFNALPRVDVSADAGIGSDVVDEVKAAINYSAKMRVVASEAERAKLRALRIAQQSAHVSDESKCKLGNEVAPNNSLVVSRAKDGGVKLKLLSIETGCEEQSSTGPTARDAVENLIGRLRVPLEWPGGGKKPAPSAPQPTVSEARLGGGSSDFDLAVTEQVVAQFESEPAGATVLLDGKVVCKETPCNKSIPSGRHDVTMSLDMYDDASQSVNISKASKKTRLVLPPAFATVTVETVPPGLPVEIDGKPMGSGPQRLEPGAHEVMVRDRCFIDAGERIVVRKGDNRRVSVAVAAKMSGLSVSAEDEKGNDLEADVEVDGKPLGTTPVTAKVATCSKEVVVKASGGRTWKQALSLKEREIQGVVAKPKSAGNCPTGMAFIPGGAFDMGSNEGDSDEKPVHRVTLSGFCMDVTEYAEGDGNPKVNVSWDEAKALCERQGKRLPTEAEWEFAARRPSGRKYPWGNGEPGCDRANYSGCGGIERVGSSPAGATPEGLQDMAGNVWEWVYDCYGSYSLAEPDPLRTQCSGSRVLRGGGWRDGVAWLRVSRRFRFPEGIRSNDIGFRCARGVGQ